MSSGRFANWPLPDLRVELDIESVHMQFAVTHEVPTYLTLQSTLLSSRFLVSGLRYLLQAAFYEIRGGKIGFSYELRWNLFSSRFDTFEGPLMLVLGPETENRLKSTNPPSY